MSREVNKQWLTGYITDLVVPEFESYREVVVSRVLPVFDNFMV